MADWQPIYEHGSDRPIGYLNGQTGETRLTNVPDVQEPSSTVHWLSAPLAGFVMPVDRVACGLEISEMGSSGRSESWVREMADVSCPACRAHIPPADLSDTAAVEAWLAL